MRLLLDTATFIWALQSPERLSARALSALSTTEIAIKTSKGKLGLHREDILIGLADLRMQVRPLECPSRFQTLRPASSPRRPFDRQILAQALAEKIPVVTSDEKFHLYPGIDIIW